MKYIIIFILIIASVECVGQVASDSFRVTFKTVVKTYSDTTGDYIIKFKFIKPEESKIFVYKIYRRDTSGIGETFRGRYIVNENLRKYILKAKKSKDNK